MCDAPPYSCPRAHAHARNGLHMFIAECRSMNVKRILDIGAGWPEYHADDMRGFGFRVDTIDRFDGNTFRGTYPGDLSPRIAYDAIWCAHVLEHQRDPGHFLDCVFRDLCEGGVLAVTVPPQKSAIVGGHVTIWNVGLLVYHLVLAGFDCRDARALRYGYNITALLRKRSFKMPTLVNDTPDLEALAAYFPPALRETWNGDIENVAWGLTLP